MHLARYTCFLLTVAVRSICGAAGDEAEEVGSMAPLSFLRRGVCTAAAAAAAAVAAAAAYYCMSSTIPQTVIDFVDYNNI